MRITVLYPFFDHPAIEERYASWQTQMRLRQASDDVYLSTYDRRKSAADAAAMVAGEYVLVVTDPLLVPSPGVADRLMRALDATAAEAAVPVTNEAANAAQRVAAPAPYLTLRELETAALKLPQTQPATVAWDDSDPGLFLCRTAWLASIRGPVTRALAKRKVAIARDAFVHRWPVMRAGARQDLLPLIDPAASSVLETGCGEGSLGALVKQRQKCRYVGIELDRNAAAIARRCLDDVYCGDVNEIVAILEEKFEVIVCSEILEHVSDPWTLLMSLRDVCEPGGRIVISIPNIATAAVIADLLQGRFEYTYVGLVCAGHLRFFTRRSIEEMMSIAGWQIERIEPQHVPSSGAEELVRELETRGIAFSREDLLPTGFYVIARNGR
ncbi:MAG: class I SAM-dependent methyltransferase [Acidobacteriota bacterium]|nr:class I SAM-dependent methyltransferase [Acidobacteriota bacterium]